METKTKNNGAAQGAAAKGNEVKTQNRPNVTGKEAKNEKAENQNPAETPKAEEAKTTEVKAGNAVTVDHQPAHVEEQPKAEELKKEEPKAEIHYIKPPQNVEATIKEVEALHRRSIQRANLIARKKQLEAFEVALLSENDELNDNPFQGCKLIIEDDKKRQFVTTTPGLIRLTAQFIYDACNQKQAEIEANIVFPNA